MTYANSATLVASDSFKSRVGFSVLNAAISIMNEAPDDTKPARGAKRISLAWQQITALEPSAVFVRLCAANPAIASAGDDAPDGDIDFVVSSVWDAVAGVTYIEVNPPAPPSPPAE